MKFVFCGITTDIYYERTTYDLLKIASRSQVLDINEVNKFCIDCEMYETYLELMNMNCTCVDSSYNEEYLEDIEIIETPEITEFNRLLNEVSKYDKNKAKSYNTEACNQEYSSGNLQVELLDSVDNHFVSQVKITTWQELYDDERNNLNYFLDFRYWFIKANTELTEILEKNLIKKEKKKVCRKKS